MTTPTFRPKYISFDCYGTLTRFRMGEMAESLYGDRVGQGRMPAFVKDFAAYRLDEILGAWKPFAEVLANALRRTCALHGVEYRGEDGRAVYEAVPTWGPHADVPAGLSRVADQIPLIILSNAMNSQIGSNVEKLGAPFHRVYTAEQAQAYKPRLQAFEYMFEQLGAKPEDMMHVSSSFRYDHMSAFDLRFGARVWVNRGHEPRNPAYFTHEIADIGGLAGCVGL